jgi:hypothetical protein
VPAADELVEPGIAGEQLMEIEDVAELKFAGQRAGRGALAERRGYGLEG